MPLYEYRCLQCGEQTEVLRKYSDPPLRRCEKCRGKLEKLVSRSAFHLKGGGWYAHGYGTSESSKSGSKDTKDRPDKSDKKDKSGKKDGGKTEASVSGSEPKKAASAAR